MAGDLGAPVFTPELDGIWRPYRAALIVFWVAFFTFNFFFSWRLMEKLWPRFRSYNDSKKADNASRVNSTVHALLVSPSLLFAFQHMTWGPFLEPLDDPWLFQFILVISVGYFISDFFVLVRYHPPLWNVFVIHHVMACIPYLIYFFREPCAIGINILGVYMLVELTNLTYNAKLWMEECGLARTKTYAFLLYASALEWFVFRNINPALAVYYSHTLVTPNAPNAKQCLGPGLVCGWFVNLFCGVAFFVVFVKEIWERWHCKGAWEIAPTLQIFKKSPRRPAPRIPNALYGNRHRRASKRASPLTSVM